MFNLEQSIMAWRRQMLAAGISAHALDELESHLREEIDQRKKSGSSEADAFHAAVREIGHRKTITREFKKIETNDPMETAIDSLIQIIGWIATGWILILGFARLDTDWDLSVFDVRWNLDLLWAICEILVAGIGIWFLAKVNRDGTSRIVSLLICLCLGWIAVINYHHQTHPRVTFGGALESNPFWYCWGTTLLLLMPAAFWIWRRWTARRKKQRPINEATIVAERIFSVVAAFYSIFISIVFFGTGCGASHFFVAISELLIALLIICAGCVAHSRIEKMRRARRRVE